MLAFSATHSLSGKRRTFWPVQLLQDAQQGPKLRTVLRVACQLRKTELNCVCGMPAELSRMGMAAMCAACHCEAVACGSHASAAVQVCTLSLPRGEVRKISQYGVFVATAIFALWAYLWAYICIDVWTPGALYSRPRHSPGLRHNTHSSPTCHMQACRAALQYRGSTVVSFVSILIWELVAEKITIEEALLTLLQLIPLVGISYLLDVRGHRNDDKSSSDSSSNAADQAKGSRTGNGAAGTNMRSYRAAESCLLPLAIVLQQPRRWQLCIPCTCGLCLSHGAVMNVTQTDAMLAY